jgi:hypothetical protein
VWRLPGEVFRVISSDPFYYYFFFGALFFSFFFSFWAAVLEGVIFIFLRGEKLIRYFDDLFFLIPKKHGQGNLFYLFF